MEGLFLDYKSKFRRNGLQIRSSGGRNGLQIRSSGGFYLHYNSNMQSNLTLKIYNVIGDEIDLISLDKSKQNYYYNNTTLANGLYTYFIYSDNSVIGKGKFVVVK